MKIKILFLAFVSSFCFCKSQSCDEIIKYVKSKNSGITYYSTGSSAISQVTFYSIYDNYKTYYFAIVKFTSNYYREYIYQVGSNTGYNYSMKYMNSAGEAFWKFIHPYNKSLGCAPTFD
ncbi:hypothetical protein [Chryseobacterium sp. CFS15]|uniref:hypothetical protein n=1 Tax=Chryseobacterium TaxID=59732 RepID=UPI0028087E1F|nr:hypothetical protein [Chryseobacterium sp. CFS15]MDQ8141036.1 hypothetical protein [Chryseobacterium sp. CFS15]